MAENNCFNLWKYYFCLQKIVFPIAENDVFRHRKRKFVVITFHRSASNSGRFFEPYRHNVGSVRL